MAKAKAKKTASKKKTTKRRSRKKAEAGSRGLAPAEVGPEEVPAHVEELADKIEADGGRPLARFRDPLGGKWQLLAALPLELVEPTPFQRDLSESHAKRMTQVIGDLDRFLDPILCVRKEDGKYWTPNGLHRFTAMGNLGAKSIVALVVPEFELVYKILALNTERAHNLKEKALEVIRMARALADITPQPETDFSLEFEEPSLLTLGICYEQRARFAGSAYGPAFKKAEVFMELLARRGHREARGLGHQAPRDRRPRQRDHQGPQGQGLRLALPQELRRRTHQPAALRQGGRCGRSPREDGRQGRQVRHG